MPVPVPIVSKPPAHPLKHTLPVSPTGPPPSFGSRDQWINSLPSWRRTKTRRIWEDDSDTRPTDVVRQTAPRFRRGLADADNAFVIKGAHVEACIPPLSAWIQDCGLDIGSRHGGASQAAVLDEGMGFEQSTLQPAAYSHASQWDASSPKESMELEMDLGSPMGGAYAWSQSGDVGDVQDTGAFSPVLEDDSPGMVHSGDIGSSPIGPLTPFGDYVDRAVSATHPSLLYNSLVAKTQDEQLPYECQPYPYLEPIKDEPVATEPEPYAPVTLPYKKLAEPIAEWMISYVWKVCTHAIRVPSSVARYRATAVDLGPNPTPLYLTGSVHSLLMSTLLQPSAILLALWYIARLPVYLGAAQSGQEYLKDSRFRAELFGDAHIAAEGDVASNPTFRLIVLGCMLANKWLDDHTFSNKTWHTISGVPTHSLNKLEFLALDVFSHDLSISPSAWSEWLGHLFSYHQSLSSQAHPQPISRPFSSPHSIIRKTIEEIAAAPHSSSDPVFLGLEQRTREKLGLDEGLYDRYTEGPEIDLDEDGPLREEYLPKRRVSNGSSYSRHDALANPIPQLGMDYVENHGLRHQVGIALPPPAKWSPAGDEPIFRDRNAASGRYMAVQPSLAPQFALPAPVPYQCWPSGTAYVSLIKGPPGASCTFAPFHQGFSHYPISYPCGVTTNVSHIRSQSQSYCDSENFAASNHSHSYPQCRYGYRCSDIRTAADEMGMPSQVDPSWPSMERYGYEAAYRPPFGPHPSISHHSTWPRA
ncbi:hypothetical protein BV22DRAFT_1125195 [Leucogyrophana mollusca]|uniref:Uncharacterized protein n=1 Tax=Leucogyrophana mollusca TaxID=85980 RepID=A0ACB8BZH4_9AGAM|nr:hypothetical protein BV22DRAFT_1125195 [Leucogyrophana mollusca]